MRIRHASPPDFLGALVGKWAMQSSVSASYNFAALFSAFFLFFRFLFFTFFPLSCYCCCWHNLGHLSSVHHDHHGFFRPTQSARWPVGKPRPLIYDGHPVAGCWMLGALYLSHSIPISLSAGGVFVVCPQATKFV